MKDLQIPQLIDCFDQGSNVLRHNAQLEIISRTGEYIDLLLMKKAEDKSASLEARIAALYAINLRNQSGAVEKLKLLLKDDSIKEYALRALIDRKEKIELTSEIKSALSDSNPRVQMAAAFGAGLLNLNELTEDLLKISDDSSERTPLVQDKPHVHRAVPHTARRALVTIKPVSELLNALKNPALKQASLAVLRQIHDRNATQSLINELKAAKSIEEKMPIIKVLLRTYHREEPWNGTDWWGTKPNSSGPYYKAIPWEMSETISQALRNEVKAMNEEQQKQLLFQIRLHNISLDELKLDIKVDPIEQLVEQPSHSFSQLESLLSAVNDTNRTDEFRTKAFRAAMNVKGFRYKEWCIPILNSLGQIPEESDLYKTLSQDFITSSSHRVTFLQRISKTYPAVSKLPDRLHRLFCDMVVGLIQSPLTSDEDRNKLISGIQKSPSVHYLESIADNKAMFLKRVVNDSLKSKNKKLAAAAEKAQKALSNSKNRDSEKLVSSLEYEALKKAILTMEGDIETGKKLFTRQSCIVCHSVKESEPPKGPYLGNVGNLFNREQLITHIVKPNAEVAQGFQSYTFNLKDGSTAMGFVTARDDKQITVRTMTGISQTIQADNVKDETVSSNSMMPPGLVNTLTLKEFASLIDYLQSLH